MKIENESLFLKSCGEIIKISRKAHRITQENFAVLTGVSRKTMSNFENGKSMPNFQTTLNVIDSLGITYDDFLVGVLTRYKELMDETGEKINDHQQISDYYQFDDRNYSHYNPHNISEQLKDLLSLPKPWCSTILIKILYLSEDMHFLNPHIPIARVDFEKIYKHFFKFDIWNTTDFRLFSNVPHLLNNATFTENLMDNFIRHENLWTYNFERKKYYYTALVNSSRAMLKVYDVSKASKYLIHLDFLLKNENNIDVVNYMIASEYYHAFCHAVQGDANGIVNMMKANQKLQIFNDENMMTYHNNVFKEDLKRILNYSEKNNEYETTSDISDIEKFK